MPQRFLRPGITTSQRFNSITYEAQTFFVRLMTLVDDFGRYEADSRLLRSHAFPFGDPVGKEIKLKTVENMCWQLSTAGLAIFYQVGGKQFLQLLKWEEKPRALTSKYEAFTDACEQMFASDSRCSSPSSSSSPSSLSHRHSSNGSHEPTEPTDDLEWLSSIRDDPAYKGIDVEREYGKMNQWCKVAKKLPSRKRFINWLNRVERPLNVQFKPATRVADKAQPKGWHEWVKEHYPDAREHDFWRVSDDVRREFQPA